MGLLLSAEIHKAIKDELISAKESVQIITAYCKEAAISELNSYVPREAKRKRIMIRFLLSDVLSGSTDFNVIKYCMSEGWEVYLRFDLHAKTYIVDNKRAIVGSANATLSGLSTRGYGNTELSTIIDMEEDDLNKIESMYLGTIHVTEEIMQELEKQYTISKTNNLSNKYPEWSKSIQEKFIYRVRTLFPHEFPDKSNYQIGEFAEFLGIQFADKDSFKENVKWSNSFRWLIHTLQQNNNELYFGSLTEQLHSVLVSDPKPYRKDVKEYLSNLLELINWLEFDDIVIDRPNYSQRVRLL